MLMRNLLNILISLIVSPIGIILYIILESLRVAKAIEVKIDKIKKGKK